MELYSQEKIIRAKRVSGRVLWYGLDAKHGISFEDVSRVVEGRILGSQVGVSCEERALGLDVVFLQADGITLPGRAMGTGGVLHAVESDVGESGIFSLATIGSDGSQSVEGRNGRVEGGGRVGIEDKDEDNRLYLIHHVSFEILQNVCMYIHLPGQWQAFVGKRSSS